MKKTKEIGKKDERMEYKKEITKDKAAKIITNEIITTELHIKTALSEFMHQLYQQCRLRCFSYF